jgi:hypothetical protein
MTNLSTKIRIYVKEAGKTVNFGTNVFLQNDGNGAYIKEWNIEELAQPTDEQLNALESKASILESNNQVIKTRKKLYGSITEQLEYIVENGVSAFITKQLQIKTENPKS